MSRHDFANLPGLLETLGLNEEPMGLFYTDNKPPEGATPRPMDTPTREKEIAQQIDWQEVFGNFSCVLGHVWRARKKKQAAYFSAEQFGCPGGAFWLWFLSSPRPRPSSPMCPPACRARSRASSTATPRTSCGASSLKSTPGPRRPSTV